MSIDCLLVADDLTGACDAAVHFAMRGLRTVVPIARGAETGGADVIGVSTESRDLQAAQIRSAMAAVTARYPVDDAARVFKKIDSTLRGNTGVEVAAAMESFGCDAAVVCPAFPKMRRVVRDGVLRVTNAAEFEPVDVAGRLGVQSGVAWTQARPEGLASLLATGARFVSVDAECDGDLDGIAAELFGMGRRVLWAGSAGLASALGRRLGNARAAQSGLAGTGAVLFCIGSDHAVTMAQQGALLAGRRSVLLHPEQAPRDEIGEALRCGQHVVLRIPRGRISAGEVWERIHGARAAALVLSGGDTASLVCEAAGVQRIELCDEIVAGIPRGMVRGGEFDGIGVATKSGGFGDRDALIQVADCFACPKQA